MPEYTHGMGRLRRDLRGYINRENGFGNARIVTVSADELQMSLPQLMEASRALILNDDGTHWLPQEKDGTFPALPGYDYPL